jgi:hypothetical protein
MAIATATAIALGITAATTTASFVQAAQQRKLANQAEEDAFKAMAEARKKTDINTFENLSINKDIYNRQRDALLSSGQQILDEGSNRGAAATAGRVMGAMNVAQQGITDAQIEEKQNLDQLIAAEESRLRDISIGLDLAEAQGAQQAAADASTQSAAAMQAGFSGLASMGSQIGDIAPLYGKNVKAEQQALSGMEFTPEEFQKFESLGTNPRTDGFSDLDFTSIGNMSRSEYKDYLKTLSPQQQKMLFTNPQYLQNYGSILNPFTL